MGSDPETVNDTMEGLVATDDNEECGMSTAIFGARGGVKSNM
jgi:hypothetical protein